MNWDALGAIAEMVGAIAVIGTFIYLTIQIRQSNRLLLAQHREINRAAQNQIDYPIIADREVAELIVKSEENPDDLDRVEARRIEVLSLNELLNAHGLFLRGSVMSDARVMDVSVRLAVDLIAKRPLAREVFESQLDGWDIAFRERVKTELANL